MKSIQLIFCGATPTLTFIAPGIYKVVTSDTLTEGLIVANQVPNQNMEDWGGWNFIDPSADTYSFPTGYSISVKQYLAFASEFAQSPPLGCLANYRTLNECAQAVEDGTNIQGAMLNDNI